MALPDTSAEQPIFDALAEWVNKGGWTITHRLRKYEEECGITRFANVQCIEFAPAHLKITLVDGAVMTLTSFRLDLPNQFSAKLEIKVPHTRQQQGPNNTPLFIDEWTVGLTITAPEEGNIFSQQNIRWKRFVELLGSFYQEQIAHEELERREGIIAQIKQNHPDLTDIRIACTQEEGWYVELDLPGGTTVRLKAILGIDQYGEDAPFLTIDGLTI